MAIHQREAQIVPILADATYTTNPTAGTEYPSFFPSNGYRGIRLIWDLNANASTSLTLTLQGYAPVGADKYTLLATAAKTSDAVVTLLLYPGAPVTSNVSANDILPAYWAVTITGTDDDAAYSLTAELYD
jgi:hypothetical protein